MNRYVVRALVAVLTFCIGVAVGRRPHRPRHAYERRTYCKKVFKLEPAGEKYEVSYPGPFLSIDATQADPLKLTYSATTLDQTIPRFQHVEFLVNTNSKKAIATYTVSYQSAWGHYGSQQLNEVVVRKETMAGDSETFSIECEGRETLTVWISKVQFKDGTQWENPRHRVGQTNL